jgi:hypothetical protein
MIICVNELVYNLNTGNGESIVCLLMCWKLGGVWNIRVQEFGEQS